MTSRRVRSVALMLVGAFLLTIWTVPILLAVVTSLKDEKEVLAYPPTFWFAPTLKSFHAVLFGPTNILGDLVTSLIIAVATTVLTIVIAVPAAYAFARLKLPGRKPLGFYVLATQLVPPIGLIIPYFLILNRIGWMDSYKGLVLIYMTFSLPFAIWLLVSYFEDIPREMEEAALIDRANRWQALWHVVLPQARGAIAVTVIFVFLNAWNEFLFAVVLGGANVRPVTVSMYNYINTEQTQWAQLAAAALMAMLPVIVLGLAAQKHIVNGLTAGAVKGVGRR
ncbi:MAG TPA: carbohydrate ABC transporter permease [Burkholderiales bacterium]|nr:carbohydrate ABC transporter permease [Burkholderiales bacterium]